MPRIAPLVGPGYKYCPGCQLPKPEADFYRNKDKPGGRCPKCKICHRAAVARSKANCAQRDAMMSALVARQSGRTIDLTNVRAGYPT